MIIMGCSIYQEKASDYIDNQLPGPERQQVEAHLSICSDCDTIYQELMMICQASRSLPDYDPPDSVWEGILSRISPPRTRTRMLAGSGWAGRFFSFENPLKTLSPGSWSWQPALAALFVFVSIAMFMLFSASRQQTEPQISPRINEQKPLRIEHVKFVPRKPRIETEIVLQRIDQLQKRIRTTRARWSPEVQALYRKQLQTADYCLTSCQSNFTARGDDPALRAVYQSALRAKLELLKQYSGM